MKVGVARLELIPVVALLPFVTLLGACDPAVEESDEPDDEEIGGEKDHVVDEDPDADQETPDGDVQDTDPEDPPKPPPQPKPQAVEICDLDAPWGGYDCTTENGEEGANFCLVIDGEELWTECSTQAPECEPGDNWDMGCVGEICYWDGEALRRYSWSEPDCNTPLVLNFDDGPVEFSPASAASFDMSSDGSCMSTDWPTAPWLAMDRDGDGFIRDASELFGNATKLSSGGYAQHGFAALAELDTNGDGKISAEDERFGELVVWNDFDGDRIGAYAELRPLSETSLVSIDLGFTLERQCDRLGNCGFERASFEYRTAQGVRTGEVVDVHLACR
jgi:hypothetical protein